MAPDADFQTRHVQFQGKAQRASQSANVLGKTRDSLDQQRPTRRIASATFAPRPFSTASSAPVNEPSRPFSRVLSTKNSLKEFRRHPERFLSKSNRYLSILRRQATSSPLSDGFDLACEEAKSFLSEDIDGGCVRALLSLPPEHCASL